ncbi:hypothetical protein MKW98_031597 [Papaver atlanticum]|uniref:3'-5' exonuclease domain-containing protein n=1 Tax=Papaver atlanticum TaxID=357466 RepID=A0AAD4X8L1_9MAGN|nr:hypothetical protein MKW98_031597 [Papaver atlanticum]
MERNNITSSYDEDGDPAPDVRIAFTNFFGTLIQTTVTSRPEIIHQWIYHHWQVYGEHYGNRLIVGVGVQWRPSNQRRAHTLQLCIDTRCLLIQLSHTPRIPQVLHWFLGDRNIHFVGIRNDSDYRRLLNNEHVLSVPNLINVSDYFDHSESSLRDLARLVLGVDGVRRDTLVERSDWSARDLTIDQVQYAVVDAYVSFQVGRAINIWRVHNYWYMCGWRVQHYWYVCFLWV